MLLYSLFTFRMSPVQPRALEIAWELTLGGVLDDLSRRLDRGNATSTQQVVAAGIGPGVPGGGRAGDVWAGACWKISSSRFRMPGIITTRLLERVQQEWDAGRLPLWAPEASAGTPLLGNPTAAVLYPGKLLFFVLPHAWAVRVFLVGHVALAYLAMWVLLRGWRISATGATLRLAGVCFWRTGAEPDEQHDLPGWGFVGASGVSGGGSLGAVRQREGRGGNGGRAGTSGAGRRSGSRVCDGVCAMGYAVGLQLAGGKRRVGEWLPWTLVGFAACIVVLAGSVMAVGPGGSGWLRSDFGGSRRGSVVLAVEQCR